MKAATSILFCFMTLLCACSTGRKPDTLPRPSPGYAYWMEKQSLVNQAGDLIAQVTQSERIWLMGGEPGRSTVLLENAPNWLDSRDNFSDLAGQTLKLAQAGITGIYLGQTGETPDLWLTTGEDQKAKAPASLEFSPALGTEKDFARLDQACEDNGLQLGAALIPGYTGRGPDFALQTRKVTGHAGLYAMLPVPENAVHLLPANNHDNEWASYKLSQKETEALIAAGVLPASIARDNLTWASPGGWACTAPVTGADGMARRWLYRYSHTPDQPVVAWQDPSGQAERIFSAAIIRHTGLLGMALAGLHMEPLMGLEPGEESRALSPGLEAINNLSRQIHRYGGWAMQADPVPAEVMAEVLKGPCDFCRDDLTEILVLFGLLQADGRPLAHLYRTWINEKADISRHSRGLAREASSLLFPEEGPYATVRSKFSSGKVNPERLISEKPEIREALRQFSMAWKIGLPGLAFIRTAEISGHEALLKARKKSGLAAGKVISVTRGRGGGFGLLSELPKGGFWLLICNFGVNADELVIDLPQTVHNATFADGSYPEAKLHGNNFRMGINGRTVRHIIFN